jgi:hypothetical protein
VLEQNIASAARKAFDRHAHGLLDAERIEQLAVQAAERQLAELADPPGLYYLTLEEWVHEWLFPVYRRSVLRARPRLVPGRFPPRSSLPESGGGRPGQAQHSRWK